MRKPQSQPALAALGPEDRLLLASWLRSDSYDAVLERVKKPRSEGGFDLHISKRPLQTFYAKVALLDLINSRLGDDKKMGITEFESLSAGILPGSEPSSDPEHSSFPALHENRHSEIRNPQCSSLHTLPDSEPSSDPELSSSPALHQNPQSAIRNPQWSSNPQSSPQSAPDDNSTFDNRISNSLLPNPHSEIRNPQCSAIHEAILETARDLVHSGDHTPAQLLALQRLADFPARAEFRAHKIRMDLENAARKKDMDAHRKRMAEERLALQKRSLALREQEAADRRASAEQKSATRNPHSAMEDHLGPYATTLDEIEARAIRKFGLKPRSSSSNETLEGDASCMAGSTEQPPTNLPFTLHHHAGVSEWDVPSPSPRC